MNSPIFDFIKNYSGSKHIRAHMPGHKGMDFLGCEHLDITEISGADSLFDASGIIGESEANASSLFGCPTFYSTEGSSLCIRAMLYLISLHAANTGKRAHILAARNSHKTFVNAAAMLDIEIDWIFPENGENYLSCVISPKRLDALLDGYNVKPCAVYITSPDYIGNICDIAALSEVCKKHGVILAVDNAHGAYLKFKTPSMHPIDLGADICCDSAHKTLPVLTGGAYLHISDSAPDIFAQYAKKALSLFASTSPSYLILASLDIANTYIYKEYNSELSRFTDEVKALRKSLELPFIGDEDIKLTLDAKAIGYTGTELAGLLSENTIEVEFADPDLVVLMLTPQNTREDLVRIKSAFDAIPKKSAISEKPPQFHKPEPVVSPREALLSVSERLPIAECESRILAFANVSCPPAVPIVSCGEKITAEAIRCFEYYGIEYCDVIK